MRSRVSMFNNSQNVNIKSSSLTVKIGPDDEDSLDLLFESAALNAILNAGGRGDEVRCYPGTREEIIGRVERWMDGRSNPDHRMLWLSGPAGAGKSAIAQTVAERGAERGVHAANFFFFRGDDDRNHVLPFVPTLVYQLFDFYPALRERIADCLATKPLTYKACVKEQFSRLVASPMESIYRSSPIDHKIVLIIDGLDECEEEAVQVQILGALHALVSKDNSPFRVFISSRAEPSLVMFFNRIGDSVESVFLSEEFRPEEDIRKFVIAKFNDIKQAHHLAHTLSKDWPAQGDIDKIVFKSSGQFIYAATVMRFIEFSRDSPIFSLLTVHHMQPSANHSPFAQLDAVYSHIFSKVRNIRVIQYALGLRGLMINIYGGHLLHIAGYKTVELQSVFTDISAIARISVDDDGSLDVDFYHESLPDYLENKSRSGIYHMDKRAIAADMSTICLQNFCDAESFSYIIRTMAEVEKPTAELSKSLLDASKRQIGECLESPSNWHLFISTINRLYFKTNKALFRHILQGWIHFAYAHKINASLKGNRKEKAPYRYYGLYRVTEKAKFALSHRLNK